MNAIIIDTGIDLKNNNEIILGYKNILSENIGINDDNGHGTMCGRTISLFSNTKTNLYIIKGLNENKEMSTQNLIDALKYTIEIDIRLISLSLSTIKNVDLAELEKIVKELYKNGKIIVAAVPNSGEKGYPAYFDNVIGVDGGILKNQKDFLYNQNYEIQCIANRMPVLIKERNNNYAMFGGTSKATAIISAYVGDIIEKFPDIDYCSLQTILSEKAIYREWNLDNIDTEYHCMKNAKEKYNSFDEYIHELVKKFIASKGIKFNEADLFNFGYNRFLIGNDFINLIYTLEDKLNIILPYYEGIDFRFFENAISLRKLFEGGKNNGK